MSDQWCSHKLISGKQGVAGFPEIRFYLHKEFRAAEIGFSLHKEFHKKNHETLMVYLKNFRAARANLLKFHKKNDGKSMVSIGNEQLGAMRQKMANFKRETAFAGVQMFFQELSFYIQKEMNSWGRCVGKWRFSKRKKQRLQGTVFSGAFILYSERNEQLNWKIDCVWWWWWW